MPPDRGPAVDAERSPRPPDPPARTPFKAWFNADLVEVTARRFEAADAAFAGADFRAQALHGLESHEMMGRVGQIADALRAALPASVPEAMEVLVRALPPLPDGPGGPDGPDGEPDPEGITSSGHRLWPWGEAVARYAKPGPPSELEAEAAFRAMLALTRRFTAEFAVRPWLAADPDRWLDRLEPLVLHPSEHVRRWVSEGTRTRLPWGKRVPPLQTKARTERRLRILRALHRDPSAYVRRSVANHLQDALKDRREWAFPTLAEWARSGNERAVATARHAARGLLREGDAETLALFGYPPGGGGVRLGSFTASALNARVGEAVDFHFRLEAPHLAGTGEAGGAGSVSPEGQASAPPTPLRLDLRMEHPGAGTRRRQKTFRVASLEVPPGVTVERTFTHAFVNRSTRTVRPGPHRFVARLNGVDAGSVQVDVRGTT